VKCEESGFILKFHEFISLLYLDGDRCESALFIFHLTSQVSLVPLRRACGRADGECQEEARQQGR